MKSFLGKDSKKPSLDLIVISIVALIIIILSVIILVNYGLGGYKYDLEASAYRVAQDIRKAGEMAMFVEEFEDSIPPGGYGINFNLSSPLSYFLFADNGNHIYDLDDPIIKKVNLEGEAIIVELHAGNKRVIKDIPLNIIFTPPNPDIKINLNENSGAVILKDEKTNETINIKVNSVGLVEVQ